MTELAQPKRNASSIMLIVLLACAGTLFFKNGLYLFCCSLTIVAIIQLLWKNFRPGVLPFAFSLQWLQVITYVVWMNVRGVDINFLSPHASIAIVMSCIGLIVMAMVISGGIKSLPVPTMEFLKEEAIKINERKMLFLYLGSTFFLSSIGFILGISSGATQILVTLSSLKWIFLLVYGYISWIKKKNRLIFTLIVVGEFVTALYSYFSSFKQVLLIVIILAITFIVRVTVKQLLYGLLIAVLLGFLAVTWTAIKGDYRNYVSQGQKQQIVSVSREDALGKISEQVGGLTSKNYDAAMMITLYRLQYVYHLARTMDRVPQVLPHENGQLWIDNISFVLLPRFLFPNKPVFDATQKTNKYTGSNYGGFSKGTSFGIGYFSDCYIDFGYIGMMLPLSLIALFIVGIYRLFYKMVRVNMLFRYALINITLFNFSSFESDGIIVIGRLLITSLVFGVIAYCIFPVLQKWLYKQ